MRNYRIILLLFLFISAYSPASTTCIIVGPSSINISPSSSSDDNYRVSCLISKTLVGDFAPNITRHYGDLNKEQSIAVSVCYAFLPANTSAIYYGLGFLIPSGGVPDWCKNEDGCKTEQSAPWNCGSDFVDENCRGSDRFSNCGECSPRIGTLCCCRGTECNRKFAAEFGMVESASSITNFTNGTATSNEIEIVTSEESTSTSSKAPEIETFATDPSTTPSTITSSKASVRAKPVLSGGVKRKNAEKLYEDDEYDSDSEEHYNLMG